MKYLLLAILFAAFYTELQTFPSPSIGESTELANTKPPNLEEEYGLLPEEEGDMQNDYYDGDEEPAENTDKDNEPKIEKPPQLESRDETIIADESKSARLPCKVKDLGTFVRMWYKGDDILFQSEISFKTNKRLKLHPEGTLEIENVSVDDAGEYKCQVIGAPTGTPTVHHNLIVNYPPKIEYLNTEPENKTYNTGETLVIKCRAKGQPTPTISWHKGHKEGERLEIEGETLTIENVKHRNAGQYRCLASNSLGADHRSIAVNILHKPVIILEKYTVNSDATFDVEIKCTVSANPHASVIWHKDGVKENIKANPPHIEFVNKFSQHALVIRGLTDKDFGVYSCSAINSLGKASQNITLVRTPAIGDFIKPDAASRELVLKWKVESKAPIKEHELQYRKKGEDSWKSVKPEVTNDHNDVYTIEHALNGLEAGQYEARIRSQNEHGWSEYSNPVPFEGEKSNAAQEESPAQHQETSVGASKTNGCLINTSSVSIISIALLTLFYRRQ